MRTMTRISFVIAGALTLARVAFGAPEQPTVTLVDAGADPKAELRYDIPVGMAQGTTMSMKMDSSQTMNGMAMPSQAIPEIRTPFSVKVDERSGADTKYQITMGEMEVVDDGSVPKQMIDMMRSMFAGTGGTVLRGVFDTRGVHKDIQIDTPNDAGPAMREQMSQSADSMKQMSMPLPEEAVGIGAKWTVEKEVESNGMKMKQTATCTLKERTGGTIVLDVKIHQSADPQAITNPQAPQMEIHLDALEGTGQGTMKIDLARMMPRESTMESSTKISMTVQGVQRIDQTMHMTMKLESRDDKPSAP